MHNIKSDTFCRRITLLLQIYSVKYSFCLLAEPLILNPNSVLHSGTILHTVKRRHYMCTVVFLLNRSRRLVCVQHLLTFLHMFLLIHPQVSLSTTQVYLRRNISVGLQASASHHPWMSTVRRPTCSQWVIGSRITAISREDDVCSERITRGDGYYCPPAGLGNVVFVL